MQLAFKKADKSFQDRMIAWWTKGTYSHVELIHDGYMYSSFPSHGVRKKKHKHSDIIYDYVTINADAKLLKEFYEMTKGNKYDWLGISGFLLPFKDRSSQWFCSEWCANVLKISGDNAMMTKEPSNISPNSLYKILRIDNAT